MVVAGTYKTYLGIRMRLFDPSYPTPYQYHHKDLIKNAYLTHNHELNWYSHHINAIWYLLHWIFECRFQFIKFLI